ncbi:MAG: hypothetical protein ACP5HZ_12170 [Ferrimicrobium sp.]
MNLWDLGDQEEARRRDRERYRQFIESPPSHQYVKVVEGLEDRDEYAFYVYDVGFFRLYRALSPVRSTLEPGPDQRDVRLFFISYTTVSHIITNRLAYLQHQHRIEELGIDPEEATDLEFKVFGYLLYGLIGSLPLSQTLTNIKGGDDYGAEGFQTSSLGSMIDEPMPPDHFLEQLPEYHVPLRERTWTRLLPPRLSVQGDQPLYTTIDDPSIREDAQHAGVQRIEDVEIQLPTREFCMFEPLLLKEFRHPLIGTLLFVTDGAGLSTERWMIWSSELTIPRNELLHTGGPGAPVRRTDLGRRREYGEPMVESVDPLLRYPKLGTRFYANSIARISDENTSVNRDL